MTHDHHFFNHPTPPLGVEGLAEPYSQTTVVEARGYRCASPGCSAALGGAQGREFPKEPRGTGTNRTWGVDANVLMADILAQSLNWRLGHRRLRPTGHETPYLAPR